MISFLPLLPHLEKFQVLLNLIKQTKQHDLTPRIYVLHKITIALKFLSHINFKPSSKLSNRECHADCARGRGTQKKRSNWQMAGITDRMYFKFFHLLARQLYFYYIIFFFAFTKLLLTFFRRFYNDKPILLVAEVYSQLATYLPTQLPWQLIKGKIKKENIIQKK